MEDESIFEGLIGLIGFSIFFIIILCGVLLTSINPDSFMYIKFDPPEEFLIFLIIMLLDFVLLLFYLNQASKFRISRDLNRRQMELLLMSDKMKVYCLFLAPIYGFLIYYYIKYVETGIAIHLFLLLLFEFCLVVLIFYNSYLIKRDNS